MTTKTLICIFLLIVLFAFTTDNSYTISAGVGTDKLFVGQKVKDVFSLLGKNDKYTEGIIDYQNREAVHVNRYIYSKIGLTFITYTDESKGENIANAVVNNIVFESPVIAKTNNNIVLGKDTKAKIISTFGKLHNDKDIYSNVTYYHYRKKGISFGVDNKTNRISTIEVYKRNGYPEKK